MPTHYPQEAVLRDGRRLLIRPFTEHDVDPLYEFFLRLPEDVRRFAWDRIDNRSLVEGWVRSPIIRRCCRCSPGTATRWWRTRRSTGGRGARCAWSAASSGCSTPSTGAWGWGRC